MEYEPNLIRIPGDLDGRAEQLLREREGPLSKRDRLALGRYGYRMPTLALRERSPDLLRRALLAAALGAEVGEDPRDLMIGFALHHAVARMLEMVPAELFEEVAAQLPDGAIKDLLRQFGARDGITVESFGWERVETPDGPDFTVGPGW